MLKDLRKHSKSWMIKALFVIIIVTFLSWGGYRKASNWSKDYVAKVNGEKIKRDEFEFIAYHRVSAMREQYKKYMKRDLLESEVNNIREMILTQLIENKILHGLSLEAGIPISKKEIGESIKKEEVFQNPDTHEFDFDRYKNFLKYYRKTPAMYELERKDELQVEKLRNFVTNFSKASDVELKEIYSVENTKVNLEFALFNPKDYKNKIKIKMEDVEKYFNENKDKYKTEEKRKLEYLEIDPEELVFKINNSDEELRELFEKEYKNSKDEDLKEEKILLRIISVREKENENSLKEANAIKELATSGQNFVSLAKTYSDDFTKKDGGNLGYVSRMDLSRFGNLADTIFKLKAGEIAGPIKEKNNYYIVKVEDRLQKGDLSFDRLKNYISFQIKKKKAKSMADEIILKLTDDVKGEKDFAKLAVKHDLFLKKTDYFGKSGELKSIIEPYLIQNEAFQLALNGIKEDVKTTSGISYFIKLVEINEPHIPELADAYADVEEDLISRQTAQTAKSEADKFFALVKNREDLIKNSPAFGVKIDETGEFSLSNRFEIPKIGKNEELAKEAFALKAENPALKKVYEVDGKFYVACFKSRVDADMEKFDEKKKELLDKITNEKNQNLFTTWKDLVSKEAEIKKYN